MFRFNSTIVEQFFAREEENARRVLRTEMESLMDTIFGEMKHKFMLLDSQDLTTEILKIQDYDCGDGQQIAEQQQPLYTDESNQFSSATVNSQPTNSQTQISTDLIASNVLPQFDQITIKNKIYESGNTTSEPSNQDDEIIVKNELGETIELVESVLPIASSSSTQSQSSNVENIDELFGELDEEDCDCAECVGDLFVVKNELDDDEQEVQLIEDDVQIIDESNQSNSRPTKRPRLIENENDQSERRPYLSLLHNNQAEQPHSNPTPTPNIHFIAISLKCAHCPQMLQHKNALKAHLKSVHSIGQYRCLYKACNLSFDQQIQLDHHHRTIHPTQPNPTWPCGNCSRSFPSHNALIHHNSMHHQSGIFRCSQSACPFESDLKQLVFNHYMSEHAEYACPFPGCGKKFKTVHQLKIHRPTHRDRANKPYRCKWPQCQFSSSYRYSAITHIRKHLCQTTRENHISRNPRRYLQVVKELL